MAGLPDTDDPYLLLGIDRGADQISKVQAYQRLAAEFPLHAERLRRAYERVKDADPPFEYELTPAAEDLRERLVRLHDSRRYDEVLAEVSRPVNAEREPFHPLIGALAWRMPAALELAERLRLAPDVEVARRFQRWRPALGAGDDIEVLVDLFADGAVASADRRRRTYEAIAGQLATPGALIAFCDRLLRLDGWLAGALLDRLERESRLWGKRALAPLSPEVRAALDTGLRAVRDPARGLRLAADALWVTASGATFIGGILVDASGNAAAIGASAVGAGGITLRHRLLDRSYRRHVRPVLVTLLAALGVQSDCIGAWLTLQPPKPRLVIAAHAERIRTDVPLALFASIAALAREHERDPAWLDTRF